MLYRDFFPFLKTTDRHPVPHTAATRSRSTCLWLQELTTEQQRRLLNANLLPAYQSQLGIYLADERFRDLSKQAIAHLAYDDLTRML